ncbi:uncharacterized protein [Antedon mediterranea]|uniref:uncharacterized protein n=1 Tax=Antedon mediterranea TaxID=105859 RepID=UPI003AF66F7A
MKRNICVFAIYLIGLSTCDDFPGDTSICTPPDNPPSKPFPRFPKPAFETKLEINLIKPYALSIEAHQIVDQENLKMKTQYWVNGVEFVLIYAEQEAYTMHYPDCVTTRFNATGAAFGGIRNINIQNENIVLVDLPNFGLYLNEWEYIGQGNARGIPTNMWKTCIYYEPVNATYQAEFQFSSEDYDTAGGNQQRPVRLKIMGRGLNDTTPGKPTEMVDYEYFVEYIWFRPQGFIPDFLYQVPFGVYCPDSQNQRQLPEIAQQFKIRSELAIPQYSVFTYIDEWYDYGMNLSRVDYIPISDSFDYGTVPTTRIDDFNTGVAYTINKLDGNCSIQPIPISDTSGRPVGQGGNVRMATIAELFYLDTEYFYKSVTPIRDVECDIYTDILEEQGNVTIDWLFSTNDWTATAEGNAEMTNIPIGLSYVTTQVTLTIYYPWKKFF